MKEQILKRLNELARHMNWDEKDNISGMLDDCKTKLYLYTDGEGRDQTLIIGLKTKYDEDDRGLAGPLEEDEWMDIAMKLYYDEDFGFNDLDGIEVLIRIGCNFHGIPEDIRVPLGIEDVEGIEEGDTFQWLLIKWLDWAS